MEGQLTKSGQLKLAHISYGRLLLEIRGQLVHTIILLTGIRLILLFTMQRTIYLCDCKHSSVKYTSSKAAERIHTTIQSTYIHLIRNRSTFASKIYILRIHFKINFQVYNIVKLYDIRHGAFLSALIRPVLLSILDE